MRTAASVLALGVALLARPGPAYGLPTFPGIIQDFVGDAARRTRMDPPECSVPCVLCHESAQADRDNVKQDGFIVNLRARPTNVTVEHPDLLPALQAHGTRACALNPASNPCDTDGDGVPDIAELIAGRDPDGSRDFDACPKYGCGASTVAASPPARRELGVLGVLAALGVAAALRRASPSARGAGARRASGGGHG